MKIGDRVVPKPGWEPCKALIGVPCTIINISSHILIQYDAQDAKKGAGYLHDGFTGSGAKDKWYVRASGLKLWNPATPIITYNVGDNIKYTATDNCYDIPVGKHGVLIEEENGLWLVEFPGIDTLWIHSHPGKKRCRVLINTERFTKVDEPTFDVQHTDPPKTNVYKFPGQNEDGTIGDTGRFL